MPRFRFPKCSPSRETAGGRGRHGGRGTGGARPGLRRRAGAAGALPGLARAVLCGAVSLGAAACASLGQESAQEPAPGGAPVTVTAVPLAAGQCGGGFAAHDLPHEIEVASPRVFNYDSLGAGLAAGDLDNDGDVDLVLANLDGPTALLWNETEPGGGLRFRRRDLTGAESSRPTSAVLAVDATADGWLDLAFTHTRRPPTLWRNDPLPGGAGRTFVRDPDFAAGYFAHVMDWADLDADGDLDIVTATYDYLLAKEFGGFIPGGGVAYYENRGRGLLPALLTSGADALAVLVEDLDGDGRREIIVGNDYARPDYVFTRAGGAAPPGWAQVSPLAATPTNTMSYDAGDVDNDGRLELFAADMKPYRDDAETRTAWRDLAGGVPPDDVQTDANVLLAAAGDGSYRDRAPAAGVDATGWSWSAKFGDLDQDGSLDLYVVNGVITVEVFAHLPGDELVEENQALRGDGRGGFDAAPQWGLGSTRSGRGMSMADLDGDGDLDVVVSNLRAPSQVFENRLCGGGALLIDLRLPDTANTHAIGARAVLESAAGVRQTRVVRAQSGYLSGDTSRLHFAAPAGDAPARLEITWPDGARSAVTELAAGTRLTVTRR